MTPPISSRRWRCHNYIGPVLCLNHTYALYGIVISAILIERTNGTQSAAWIFMTQSARTVDHGAPWPVPFRNALGRMTCRTTRAGPVATCLDDLLLFDAFLRVPGRSLLRQNGIPAEAADDGAQDERAFVLAQALEIGPGTGTATAPPLIVGIRSSVEFRTRRFSLT
jgi:hypothetical protein